jgi:hypothetical protein
MRCGGELFGFAEATIFASHGAWAAAARATHRLDDKSSENNRWLVVISESSFLHSDSPMQTDGTVKVKSSDRWRGEL